MSLSNIDAVLRHARDCVTDHVSKTTRWRIEEYAAVFDKAVTKNDDGDLNIFTFHVTVPETHKNISCVDVKRDNHTFEYDRIVENFVRGALASNPRARVYFVTDLFTAPPPLSSRTTIVRLPIDARLTMYERVRAMAAFVHSSAFRRDTVFLDTDAFPNAPLSPVFDDSFDIGLTLRPTLGAYMPINEGALWAAHLNRGAVHGFFDAYLATYDRLIDDEAIEAYYGDIRRWRGGQLSLNAVALSAGIDRLPVTTHRSARLKAFASDTHNYHVTEASLGMGDWRNKLVLHLKGESKKALELFLDRYCGEVLIEA